MEKKNDENMVKIPIPNEPEQGAGKEKKRPIILTACLIMDILCFLLSFAILLLLANNVPSIKVKTLITNGNIGEKAMDDVRFAAYYGIGSISICLVTAMLISVYSLVVLFGGKMYLGKIIGHELELLDSSVIDIK